MSNSQQKSYELTQSQLSIWTGQRISPDSPMYNMAMTFRWRNPINENRFKEAFKQLLQAATPMRTVFEEQEGTPRQIVKAHFSYNLEVLDLSALSTEAREAWLYDRSQRVFKLTECLFDSVLIKLGEEEYIWYLNQHHLITDAWAKTVQYGALISCYLELKAGSLAAPLELPAFSDYLAFERNNRKSTDKASVRDFWKQKAAQLPVPPALFHQNNLHLNTRSSRVRLTLNKEESDRIRKLCQEEDIRTWTEDLSLFTIFASTLFTYLFRISGQERLAIGTPAHNRSTKDFKETPGVFIELFPVETKIDREETFSSLVEKVRYETFEFLKYAQAGTSNTELSRGFNVVLNYINAAFPSEAALPMQSDWIHAGHADPGHHIRLQVYDFDASGQIELCFDLNHSIFNDNQRAQVPVHFKQLLDQFVEDRFQPIDSVPLQSVPSAGLKTQKDFPYDPSAAVVDLLDLRATSAEIAVVDGQRELSYQTLNEEANRLANYLVNNGVQKQDRVGVLLHRSAEFMISILAVLKCGASFVPLPVNYPFGRLLGIMDDAQPRLVITQTELRDTLPPNPFKYLSLDQEAPFIQQADTKSPDVSISPGDLAYVLYTSGSTGKPKGVMIDHRALSHYSQWAAQVYAPDFKPIMPLFTSTGFDLTITSLLMPLILGGTVICYQEAEEEPDLAIFEVLRENKVNVIKLTPSHLAILKGRSFPGIQVRTVIVGGEQFKTEDARFIQQHFNREAVIYNEYGPTEATVGCIVHQYHPGLDKGFAVPIGRPLPRTSVYVLDDRQHPVPAGLSGELYVSGVGLAKGYWNQPELTNMSFVTLPELTAERLYRTGDLVREVPSAGYLEYLGRKDEQIKIRGRRVELSEIEAVLEQHQDVASAVVRLREPQKDLPDEADFNCVRCGLPSNYPKASFNEEGVCNLCQSFESYQTKVKQYFREMEDLKDLLQSVPATEKGAYDCLVLLSGGKDSTYMLAKIREMGFSVLAFTLDNGFISEEAKDNIRRVVSALGVDHVFGQTDAMNEIFVDSLLRHSNVCDGCFKTIYTLSTQIALEKKIPFIITGLSRGQFFETRLTEELFRREEIDANKIDEIILNARKAYHQVDDAVKRLLDVSMFADESIFEKVRFVDFYRFTDVSLQEMYDYLHQQLPWVRPSDTGRSTNCLINQAGIYVHKKERGYSNYAFPYSWDVRIGHKTREASLEEINEEIDEQEVKRMLEEIGYTQVQQLINKHEQLVGYYVAATDLNEAHLRSYLLTRLPEYMVPVQYIRLTEIPLTLNGKVDVKALPKPDAIRPVLESEYVGPRTEFEEIVQAVWTEVLQLDKIGVMDNFIAVGGDSLSGIRIISRLSETLEIDLAVNLMFRFPTIAQLSLAIEEKMKTLMEEMERLESE